MFRQALAMSQKLRPTHSYVAIQLSNLGEIPDAKLKEMVKETRNYAFDFLEWKKEFTLKKHWLAHTTKICPRCDIPFNKEYLGRTKRRSYFCETWQRRYE